MEIVFGLIKIWGLLSIIVVSISFLGYATGYIR